MLVKGNKMENEEVFDNEVRSLLLELLEANFIDKICHLSAKGVDKYNEHILLQERYELYQSFFDSISEYASTVFWYDKPMTAYIPKLIVEFNDPSGDLRMQSQSYRLKVMNHIHSVREVSKDAALNSLLDGLETGLVSSKFKLGY